MASSPNNEKQSYSNLAERHHRRGVNATSVITGVKTSASRRRGLPEDFQREAEEREYQAHYEHQLQERRQQRAAERRETRKREIPSGSIEKRPRAKPVSETTKRGITFVLIALAALILLVGSVMAYNQITDSPLFAVKEVELQGAKQASRAELLQILEAYKARSLWQLDLQAIRAAVEKHPWVLEAEVSRVLPNALRVSVHERSLGELDFNQTDKVPPIISGLEEGASNEVKAANRRRMTVYERLMNELDQGGTKLSEEIDEIRLDDPQALRLHLIKHNVDVLVGSTEFRVRLEKAFKVLDAIERKDLSTLGFYKITDVERLVHSGRISYLNVTHAERVIVGLPE
jgi:cell division septal protein FtsQ